MRVLVTGSGGFIGARILARLCAAGLDATGAARAGGAGAVALDVTDAASCARALPGFDAVVHAAAGGAEVHVEGTANLLAAAAGAGVGRLVHLSSVSVYGDAEGVLREDATTVPPGAAGYAGWKAQAEALCQEADLPVVRLRPAIVYGPRSELWVGKMARRIRAGRWATLGAAGEGTCALVHVEDVADAALAALRAPGAPGRAFNVAGPEDETWNAWFRRLADAIGAGPLPEWSEGELRRRALLALPHKALARFVPALRERAELAPARAELALFRRRATYPLAAAAEGLGWQPRLGLVEGMRDTREWLRAQGLAS